MKKFRVTWYQLVECEAIVEAESSGEAEGLVLSGNISSDFAPEFVEVEQINSVEEVDAKD